MPPKKPVVKKAVKVEVPITKKGAMPFAPRRATGAVPPRKKMY